MTKPLSAREQLLREVTKDPTKSLAELAEKAGVSRQRAGVLLAALGYKYEPKWVKTK